MVPGLQAIRQPQKVALEQPRQLVAVLVELGRVEHVQHVDGVVGPLVGVVGVGLIDGQTVNSRSGAVVSGLLHLLEQQMVKVIEGGVSLEIETRRLDIATLLDAVKLGNLLTHGRLGHLCQQLLVVLRVDWQEIQHALVLAIGDDELVEPVRSQMLLPSGLEKVAVVASHAHSHIELDLGVEQLLIGQRSKVGHFLASDLGHLLLQTSMPLGRLRSDGLESATHHDGISEQLSAVHGVLDEHVMDCYRAGRLTGQCHVQRIASKVLNVAVDPLAARVLIPRAPVALAVLGEEARETQSVLDTHVHNRLAYSHRLCHQELGLIDEVVDTALNIGAAVDPHNSGQPGVGRHALRSRHNQVVAQQTVLVRVHIDFLPEVVWHGEEVEWGAGLGAHGTDLGGVDLRAVPIVLEHGLLKLARNVGVSDVEKLLNSAVLNGVADNRGVERGEFERHGDWGKTVYWGSVVWCGVDWCVYWFASVRLAGRIASRFELFLGRFRARGICLTRHKKWRGSQLLSLSFISVRFSVYAAACMHACGVHVESGVK
ncbi:uncharacterized protein YALI1_B10463g [Yarrowia lipolytica]|uniref:Uncharacterized protein n=1 Tax=Yarrowia lipolytica TaxID=4952 RepID=A0A1D8N6X9_YARLL|nr:hypothetical protein YALI1_B10463g [Yarrowia lipolytica]